MNKSRLRAVSPKRRPEVTARKKLIAKLKRNGPVLCVLELPGCTRWADDLDEILSRARGGSIASETNCRPVCRRCHDWVTTHPLEAAELGLTLHAWDVIS